MKHKNIAKRIGLTFLLFTAVFTFFRSSMSGIFSLFYANNGIPDAQISSIKSFQSIGLLLGLLPAGYLADRVGRLKVLNFSALTMASSFLLLIFLKGFVFYAAAELIYGIGLALNSGTLLAYITDLQEKNKIVPSSKLMGMQVTVLNIANLLGGNIGTWLFSINMKAPIWFAMIGLILYPTFVIIFIKTMNFSDNKAQKKTGFEATSLFNLLAHFLKRKSFWILLLINIGYNCGTIFVLYYWSIIYVKNLHFNLSLVYTLFMCALIFGSDLFQRINGRIASKKLTFAGTLAMIVMLIMSGSGVNRYLMLILFLLIELLMGLISGLISDLSNWAIYGVRDKSLMLSVISFITEIMVSIALFINDFIMAAAKSMTIMFYVSAVYFVSVLFAVPLLKDKK